MFNTIMNGLKRTFNYQQSFDELIANKDIGKVLSIMTEKKKDALNSKREYDVGTHIVNDRKDKSIFDKNGNFKGTRKRNKLPVPIHQYINEIALTFLYGNTPKWNNLTDEASEAFRMYNDLNDDVRFNVFLRDATRIAGAEGFSVILYHLYREEDNTPKLKLKLLSYGAGDDLYYIKDKYDRLQVFAWGSNERDLKTGKVGYTVNIYTKDNILICKKENLGWDVQKYPNYIGKIPALIFEQDPEHKNVQKLTERYERMTSVDADVNDRFADPAMMATADVINSLPKQEEDAKLYILKNGGDIRYLTWDSAPQNKTNEYQRLEKAIYNMTFTPNIDFDSMKSLGNISGKALRIIFMLAEIKAKGKRDKHSEYLSRHFNIMKAIMKNVLYFDKRKEIEPLQCKAQFIDLFEDDASAKLMDLSKQFNDGCLSKKSYLEGSYLVNDAEAELERIQNEQDENIEKQMELEKQRNVLDMFGGGAQ